MQAAIRKEEIKKQNKNKTSEKLLVRAVRHVPPVQLNPSQHISSRLAIARCRSSAAVKRGGGVKSCQPAGGERLDRISRGLRRHPDPGAGTLSTVTTSLRESPAQLDPGTHPIFISKDSFRKRRRLFIKPRCAFFLSPKTQAFIYNSVRWRLLLLLLLLFCSASKKRDK